VGPYDTLGFVSDDLRASDADREQVAIRLRRALDEGRLDLTEYDERLQQTYAAKTYGELTRLLADLPGTVPPKQAQVEPATTAHPAPASAPAPGPETKPEMRYPRWVIVMWIPWICVNALMVLIWLATDPGGEFWPFWVMVPWGVALMIPTLIGLTTGKDLRHDPRYREARKAGMSKHDAIHGVREALRDARREAKLQRRAHRRGY